MLRDFVGLLEPLIKMTRCAIISLWVIYVLFSLAYARSRRLPDTVVPILHVRTQEMPKPSDSWTGTSLASDLIISSISVNIDKWRNNAASDGSTAQNSAMTPKRSLEKRKVPRVRWRSSPKYDDEQLLLEIHKEYPNLGWSKITDLLNLQVPPKRSRTTDAVASKGKSLLKAHGIPKIPMTNDLVPGALVDVGENLSSQVEHPPADLPLHPD